jgi:hypothetical protein
VVEHDDDDEITGLARSLHARLHGGSAHHRVDRSAGVGARRTGDMNMSGQPKLLFYPDRLS